MIVFKTAQALQEQLTQARQNRQSIGFVPTMGALHPGHVSLIEMAKAQSDYVVCSIFVNPAQFNDPNDYKKYPVTTEKDITMLEQAGAHALFLPSVDEMYPGGIKGLEHYDLGYLEAILEGKYRPGHFQGVCQVMRRLLELVKPDHLFMGQKDYQQCMVVQKLMQLTGMQDHINFHICPTVREADGLAMSSRNTRLDAAAREKAALIPAALNYVKANLKPGDLLSLLLHARSMLTAQRMKVDYLEIADAITLQPVDNWNGEQKLVALAAAFLGEVRLIDNMPLN
jgi:pantoate--beta-alanine ligase